MRVALFGNVANNCYQIAKTLRKYTDWDVSLYLDDRDPEINMPENDNPELKNNYGDWIQKRAFVTASSMAAPWRSALVPKLNQVDLAIVSGFGPAFAQFANKPYGFFVTGSDLTLSPFPLKFHFLYPTVRSKLVMGIFGAWQRRGVRRSTQIWTQPFSPFVEAIERLKIDKKRISPNYYPLIIDSDKLKMDENARHAFDPNIRQIVDNYDFVLFHPSRIMINSHPKLKATGQWKRNEFLFEGFAKFLAESRSERSVLVMLDRSYSPDLARAKEMVRSLGIEKNVLWAKPPRPEGFTRDELVHYYSVSDVVADDFGLGWFGAVVLEGLSIGKPVLSYVDESVMQVLYPWNPILSVKTPDEIARCLTLLYTDAGYRQKVGLRGRQWIEEFHSPQNAGRRYIEQISELAGQLGVSG
jgi:glycosyltransferase involved in cell wall biosynthesis